MTNQQTLASKLGGLADEVRDVTGETSGLTIDEMTAALAAYTPGGGTDYLAQYADGTLVSYSSSDVATVRDYGFYRSPALVSVSLPAATIIGQYAFQNNPSLVSINIPEVTECWANSFQGCSSLTTLNVQKLRAVSNNSFQGCSSLQEAAFPAAETFANNVFSGTNLTLLNLYSPARTAIPRLTGSGVFNSTPINAGNGHVVINDELVDELKAAYRWSSLPEGAIIGNSDWQTLQAQGSGGA